MITTFTYDRANRLTLANAGGTLTTYTNDAAGNRTQVQEPTNTTYYDWNAVGQMSTAEVTAGLVTFTYNADGQRVAKQTTDGSTTGYLYDYKRLLNETDEFGGDIDKTYTTTTNEEYGDLISESGSELYHMYDAQWSTNAMLDDGGNVEARYKYEAFGQVSAISIAGDAWASLTGEIKGDANHYRMFSARHPLPAWGIFDPMR